MAPATDIQTDEKLVELLNSGSESAFTELYERYESWVMSLAFRFTGHHDDALDVLQETFAYLVRKVPHLQLSAKMTTFLYPAVRNLSIAANKKRRRSISREDLLDIHSHAPQESATACEFQELLQQLSNDHREILMMRFVDEMTQPEIAQSLNIPLGTVKSRLHHAVSSVKDSPIVKQLME